MRILAVSMFEELSECETYKFSDAFLNDRKFVYNERFAKACRKYNEPKCITVHEDLLGEEDECVVKHPWTTKKWLIAQKRDIHKKVVAKVNIVAIQRDGDDKIAWLVEAITENGECQRADLVDRLQVRDHIRQITQERLKYQTLQCLLVGGMPPTGVHISEDKTYKKG